MSIPLPLCDTEEIFLKIFSTVLISTYFFIPIGSFEGVYPWEVHGIYEILSVKLDNNARTSLD